MKEMIYGNENDGLLGVDEILEGYRLAVINVRGSHPCAYIQFPKIEELTSCDDLFLNNVDVHGGFTFLGSLKKYGLEGTWIGWDYAHYGDRTWNPFVEFFRAEDEKEWTVEEIVSEAKDALYDLANGEYEICK